MEKQCNKCNKTKPFNKFFKRKDSKDGLRNDCKSCCALRARNNYVSGQDAERSAKYRDANRSLINKKARDNYDPIKEQTRKAKQYIKYKHTGRWVEARARYRASQKNATLDGYSKELKEIYKNCPEGHEVDHIVPLQNKAVCGLHVPWNLQYLTVKDNRSKSNKLLL